MLEDWDGMGETKTLWTWFWEPARAESVILIRLLAVLLLLPSDSVDLFGEYINTSSERLIEHSLKASRCVVL